MAPRFFEDFRVGEVMTFGHAPVTREAIVAFAREFDPQPFHLDEQAARSSPYGGLIASGWHTAAMMMRMAVDEYLGPKSGSLGSPGVDEVRWLKPVRPGDTLHLRVSVLEVTPSRSKPNRGSVKLNYETLNQSDEVVMTMTGIGMFSRRPATK
jgi:acyl dehydratase